MRRTGQDEEELQAISHVATLDEYIDDYGDEPIFKCKNCGSKNSGIEYKEGSVITIIAAILCVIIFGFYAFLILPLAIEATKTMIRKCIKCDHVLDKQELLSMSSLTDKVLSFKCGGCAVVLSRKYALIAIAILVGIYCILPARETQVVNPGGIELNTKWEEYVQDCGRKVILNNQMRAKKAFDQRYAKNIVTWSGVFFENGLIKDPMLGRPLLVKMNPSDSLSLEFADVQLVFPHRIAIKYQSTLEGLTRGDVIQFKAIMKAMGDGTHYNYLEAMEIKKTGETIDVRSIPTYDYSGSSMLRKQPTGVLATVPATETSAETQQSSGTATGTKKEAEPVTPTKDNKASTQTQKTEAQKEAAKTTPTAPPASSTQGTDNQKSTEQTTASPPKPNNQQNPPTTTGTEEDKKKTPEPTTPTTKTSTVESTSTSGTTAPETSSNQQNPPTTGTDSASATTPETSNNQPNPTTPAPETKDESKVPKDTKEKQNEQTKAKDQKEADAAATGQTTPAKDENSAQGQTTSEQEKKDSSTAPVSGDQKDTTKKSDDTNGDDDDDGKVEEKEDKKKEAQVNDPDQL